jgi:hypothetical protein
VLLAAAIARFSASLWATATWVAAWSGTAIIGTTSLPGTGVKALAAIVGARLPTPVVATVVVVAGAATVGLKATYVLDKRRAVFQKVMKTGGGVGSAATVVKVITRSLGVAAGSVTVTLALPLALPFIGGGASRAALLTTVLKSSREDLSD